MSDTDSKLLKFANNLEKIYTQSNEDYAQAVDKRGASSAMDLHLQSEKIQAMNELLGMFKAYFFKELQQAQTSQSKVA